MSIQRKISLTNSFTKTTIGYQEIKMSVRATERLIGDLVKVTALPNSPQMVVKAINEETKIITTVWFGDSKCFQEGTFPANALDRVEPKAVQQPSKTAKPKKRISNKDLAKRGHNL